MTSTETLALEEVVDDLAGDLPETAHLELHDGTAYLWREVPFDRCCGVQVVAFEVFADLGAIRWDGTAFEAHNCCTAQVRTTLVQRFEEDDEDALDELRAAVEDLTREIEDDEADADDEVGEFAEEASRAGVRVEEYEDALTGACKVCDEVYPGDYAGGIFHLEDAYEVLEWAQEHKADCAP